jgi:ribosomal protein L9
VLLEEPIKELGTFMVDVELAEGFVASVKTIVVAE